MADQKHKSPEELGEAVGKKIEELFGGFFADDSAEVNSSAVVNSRPAAPPAPAPKPAPRPEPDRKPKPAPKPQPPAPPAPTPPRTQTAPRSKTPSASVSRPSPPKPPPAKTAAPTRTAHPLPASPAGAASSLDDLLEKIEVIALNLEWEISGESVEALTTHLKTLERYLPKEGPARTIVGMTMRVLPFFASEEAPHHSVSKPAMKLIQDAVAALKQIKEKQQPAQALIASISAGYKQINAALGAGKTGKAPTTSVTAVAGASSPQVNGSAVVGKVTASVKTIEEVSQRLSRILGFLRQGGAMSTEEITRRLGTLEQLLADRVVELGGLIKELGAVSEMPQSAAAEKTGPDGLVLVSWNGAFLAIPTSAVIGVYQINKSQAEQFADKSAIVIAGKQLKRFPLKKPQGAAPIVQTWLVHLKSRGNEYFLMSEKVTGFRKTPVGVDTRTQKQVKIGPNTYMIIDPALLK